MQISDLDFSYPDDLVATEPRLDFRTLWVRADGGFDEISRARIFDLFRAGDVLAINNTRVSPRRVFSNDGLEILFTREVAPGLWEVLFPARGLSVGERLALPDGVSLELVEKGIPQKVRLSPAVDALYFQRHGEMALPPYIQRARGERHTRGHDADWYQTAWAEIDGSCAAPTASLHFTREDLAEFQRRGVILAPLTLHVGLGTFLPVRAENLKDHVMHSEWCHIPAASVEVVTTARSRGRRVFALGTTALRTLESWGHGLLGSDGAGGWVGETDLYILPGFEFTRADVLMTNFHQPRSTLLALVCAFAGRETTLRAYQHAVQQGFHLFSYGDFSIWER